MLNRIALVVVLGSWSLVAAAQAPVIEAGSRRGETQQAQPQPQGNELLMTLYTQLEALQQEMQTMRGMVEELANQLRRVQAEQRDRYLDIDRRLSELSGGAAPVAGAIPGATPPAAGLPGQSPAAIPPPMATAGTQFPPNAASPDTTTQPPAVSPGNTPATTSTTPAVEVAPAPANAQAPESQLGEQELYRTALNLLVEQSQYDESIRLFQNYIDRFPQGRLLASAYYWQGEALIPVSRFEEARDVFQHVINRFPQDAKAASAMLKLGVVYQQMGDRERAEQTWREIATRYPENVTEIRAAQDYLNR